MCSWKFPLKIILFSGGGAAVSVVSANQPVELPITFLLNLVTEGMGHAVLSLISSAAFCWLVGRYWHYSQSLQRNAETEWMLLGSLTLGDIDCQRVMSFSRFLILYSPILALPSPDSFVHPRWIPATKNLCSKSPFPPTFIHPFHRWLTLAEPTSGAGDWGEGAVLCRLSSLTTKISAAILVCLLFLPGRDHSGQWVNFLGNSWNSGH